MGSAHRLGVLGGMGPLATVDFLHKLVLATPAATDREHVPFIAYSVPQIPDRVAPILRGEGDSPLEAMREGIRTLEAAGAAAIAIPCVTAHHWHAELARSASVPILHIADATCAALEKRGAEGAAVAVLATAATLRSGFIQRRLEAEGYATLLPEEGDLAETILPAIAAVKRADAKAALRLAELAVERMLAKGAGVAVLACTELPVALEGADAELRRRSLDTVAALAEACVAWAFGGSRGARGAG